MRRRRAGNRGKRWTPAQKATVKRMARRGSSTSAIANAVRRSKAAVYNKASEMNVSLMPRDKG